MLNNLIIQKNGANIALGIEGSPEEIQDTFNLLSNHGITEAPEAQSMGGDRFAYTFSTPARLEKGIRSIAFLRVLREEGHKGHQAKVNNLVKETLGKLKYGTFLARGENLSPAELGVLDGIRL